MNPGENQQASGDAQPSTADIIEQTFDEMAAADEEQNDDEIEEEAAAEEEAEAEPEAAAESEEAEESDEEHEDPELTAEAEQQEEEYNEAPPERWPAEMKEAYMNLPPEAKQMFIERVFKPMQRQYTQSTQEIAQVRATLDPMVQAMQQYGPILEQTGMDAGEAFRRQMAWAAHFAKVGPEQGISDMRDAYGFSSQQPGQEASEEYLTPVERAMKVRLDQLESHLGQATNQYTADQQAQQQQAIQARAQSIRTELESFQGEMKDGKPAHPHINKVGHAMAGLIRGGLVQKFDDYGHPIPVRQQIQQSYKMACSMDPSIKSVSPRHAERQIAQAKRANSTVVGNTNSGAAEVADRPIVNDIEDIYDQLARRSG